MATGGKYLNPQKRQVYETMMAKSEAMTTALEAGDVEEAQALAVEVRELKAQLDAGRGRKKTLNVSAEEALKIQPNGNEAIVIVRTSKGVQVSKSTLKADTKHKRVSAGIEGIWPFEGAA